MACVLFHGGFASAKHPYDLPEHVKIKLDDLVKPPKEIQDLITQGNVLLFAGQPPEIQANSRFSSSKRDRLDAETHYQLAFNLKYRKTWNTVRDGDQLLLKINVNFTRVKIQQAHGIFFKVRPGETGFWENKLVLHEFDHVRISSDPKVEKLFLSRLHKASKITKELTPSTRVNNANIDTYISKHAKTIFNDVIDMVGIRYRELDRVTSNGKRPIPADSNLLRWP